MVLMPIRFIGRFSSLIMERSVQVTRRRRPCVISVIALVLFFADVMLAEDFIEFLSGTKSSGSVVAIKKKERIVTFRLKAAGREFTRSFPYSKIHAVTYKGKRYVLNEMDKVAPGKKRSRTKAQVEKLIETEGASYPDWFEETPLEYPKTLDLKWPLKPPGKGWNNQKNVGQYIWDIINPNPHRWKSGIRLNYHLMELHEGDRKLSHRDKSSLAGMYFRFFQDYARAAYWWQQVGVRPGQSESIRLAECYWRLGNKKMAIDMLKSRTLRPSLVKLYSDMGDTRKALQIATQLAPLLTKRKVSAGDVYLHAGDACRADNQMKRAVLFYKKVLAESDKLPGRVELNKKRAQANIDAIEAFDLLDVSKVADGKYKHNSIGFSGPIHVEVTIKNGRMEAVEITEHKERQFYAAMTDTPRQLIAKQSVKGIDATTGATVTAEAIVNATAKALTGSK